MQFVTHKKVKAKKEHKCDFCGEKIQNGEEYYYSFCVDGNYNWSWKSHKRCEDIVHVLQMYHYYNEDGLTSDDFKYSINEYCQYNLKMNDDEIFNMTYEEKIIAIKKHIESEAQPNDR